ncbi:MAG: transposase [Anaerolineales bacterium]|nr:transposase [Anaerolineales bacterium]
MPVHPNFNPDYLYFATTSTKQHIHIFKHEAIIRIILDSWHFLHTDGRMKLFAYVVMPTHVHFIGKFSQEHPLSDVIRDFKRHTARQIIRQIQVKENDELQGVFQSINKDDRQEFKVWGDGYDARDVFTEDFLQQKMEYIHYNPCRPKWKLANSPEEYPWSSARFYILAKPSVIPVDDVRDLFI